MSDKAETIVAEMARALYLRTKASDVMPWEELPPVAREGFITNARACWTVVEPRLAELPPSPLVQKAFNDLNAVAQRHAIELGFARRKLAEAETKIAELEKLVYVPGVWKCAKCGCAHVSALVDAGNGNFAASTEPQRCPNDCGPMRRWTEREAGNELVDRLEKIGGEAWRAAIEEAAKIADNAVPRHTGCGLKIARQIRALVEK